MVRRVVPEKRNAGPRVPKTRGLMISEAAKQLGVSDMTLRSRMQAAEAKGAFEPATMCVAGLVVRTALCRLRMPRKRTCVNGTCSRLACAPVQHVFHRKQHARAVRPRRKCAATARTPRFGLRLTPRPAPRTWHAGCFASTSNRSRKSKAQVTG